MITICATWSLILVPHRLHSSGIRLEEEIYQLQQQHRGDESESVLNLLWVGAALAVSKANRSSDTKG